MKAALRTAWLVAILATCTPALAESNLDVRIFVNTVQSSLHPPDVFDNWGEVFVREFSLVIFGSEEFLPGLTEAPGVIAEPDVAARESPHPVQELTSRYDFSAAVNNLLNKLDFDATWTMAGLHSRPFADGNSRSWQTSRLATEQFKRDFADNLLYFNFIYFISPDLRQVRLIVDLRGYRIDRRKDKLFQSVERRYEYLGAARGVVLRPWRPGEREALVDRIETFYRDKLERYPHNAAAYRKDRKLALTEIANTRTVPASIGMLEAWSGDSLPSALEDATRHMERMIRSDLQSLDDHEVAGKRIPFVALSERGEPRRLKGYLVDRSEGQVVYRLKSGDLVSVPDDQAHRR